MIDIDYNKIYYSNNYGPYKILSKINTTGRCVVRIQFINTGAIKDVPYSRVKTGNIKDDYAPSIAGVGYIGNIHIKDKSYYLWARIINRCYNPNNPDYIGYGAIGITVCDRWKCFEYFHQDIQLLENYDRWVKYPNLYHLDKDIKQRNIPASQKVYSPETCCFILKYDNISESNSRNKEYIGIEILPSGKIRARTSIENVRYELGTYNSKELAANAYNNFMNFHFHGLVKSVNNVQYILPEEVIKYNMHPKEICKIIK